MPWGMGAAAKLCLLGGIEIFLLFTPMMFPSVPTWVGILAWTVAAALLATAFALWFDGLRDKSRTSAEEATEENKLQIVYRGGVPFLEEEYGVNEIGKEPPGYLERLIGVRNCSSRSLKAVSVQIVSATQAIRGLPIKLAARDGDGHEFSLAPNEMKLVRFLRQEASGGDHLDWPRVSGEASALVSCPCEVVVAAYAKGAHTTQKLSLSINDNHEVTISPPNFGQMPGGLSPSAYVRSKLILIKKADHQSKLTE